jgi:hypothetical protein
MGNATERRDFLKLGIVLGATCLTGGLDRGTHGSPGAPRLEVALWVAEESLRLRYVVRNITQRTWGLLNRLTSLAADGSTRLDPSNVYVEFDPPMLLLSKRWLASPFGAPGQPLDAAEITVVPAGGMFSESIELAPTIRACSPRRRDALLASRPTCDVLALRRARATAITFELGIVELDRSWRHNSAGPGNAGRAPAPVAAEQRVIRRALALEGAIDVLDYEIVPV